jgi:hypothetical protein
MKSSARRTLRKADVLYLSTIDGSDRAAAIHAFDSWRSGLSVELDLNDIAIFTGAEIGRLMDRIPAPTLTVVG